MCIVCEWQLVSDFRVFVLFCAYHHLQMNLEGTDALLIVSVEATGKRATLRLEDVELPRPASDTFGGGDDEAQVCNPPLFT